MVAVNDGINPTLVVPPAVLRLCGMEVGDADRDGIRRRRFERAWCRIWLEQNRRRLLLSRTTMHFVGLVLFSAQIDSNRQREEDESEKRCCRWRYDVGRENCGFTVRCSWRFCGHGLIAADGAVAGGRMVDMRDKRRRPRALQCATSRGNCVRAVASWWW